MLKHLQASSEWSEKNVAEKGFTLIELLVVIVILGILAAVAIFAIGGINDKAKTNACKTEVSTVETAAAAYAAQNDGDTPSDITKLYVANGGNLKKTPQYAKTLDAAGTGVTETCP